MTVEQRVKEVIAETVGLDVDTVKPESDIIVDLGADSLDVVEIIMELEEEYIISIDDVDAEKLRTVSDVVAYLKSKGIGDDEG